MKRTICPPHLSSRARLACRLSSLAPPCAAAPLSQAMRLAARDSQRAEETQTSQGISTKECPAATTSPRRHGSDRARAQLELFVANDGGARDLPCRSKVACAGRLRGGERRLRQPEPIGPTCGRARSAPADFDAVLDGGWARDRWRAGARPGGQTGPGIEIFALALPERVLDPDPQQRPSLFSSDLELCQTKTPILGRRGAPGARRSPSQRYATSRAPARHKPLAKR